MRPVQGCGGLARGFVLGVAVAALVMLTLPVVAAVGDSLLLGKANSADAVTSLSGAAASNLKVTNTRSGAPALDLRVVAGAPPLKVNSNVRVASLNADLLDGQHAAAFSLAGHNHDASYLGVGATAANSALLDGVDSSAFRGALCPPGASLVGYGRSGPLCSSVVGSVALDSTGDVGWDTSLVLDPSGFPVISYYDVANGDLKVAHCGDATCTAGDTIRTVDSAGDVGGDTSLVLDASGFPVISYYDNTNGDLKVAHCGDATCTAGNIIRTVDSTGLVGQYTSLGLDAAGRPVISYYDGSNGDLKVAHCGDATCTAGNTMRTVDSTGNVGAFASLALDAAGFPVVSYNDIPNGDLKVAHCGDATCSAGNTIRTVDSTGLVGLFTSLGLDASGFPVVAYFDYTNGDLKVAHCGDATCSAGDTIRTVDSAGIVGWSTSLVLDAAGFPVISYCDNTNGDLKLAHCGDATCTAGNTMRTVDSTGDVGWDTSLVLDAAGRPVIAYYDNTNGNLKLAGLAG